MLTLRAQALSGVLLSSILLLAGCGEERIEPSGHNVLLIAVDTLRADHLGVYGYQRATSPNLDDLASEGLVFESVQAPRAKTTPSVATLLTGLYPHDHGVRDLTQELAAEVATLPESLAAAGYATAAIIGNAYAKGRKLGRGVSYMALPSTLPLKDESGRKLCIELTTPLTHREPRMRTRSPVWSVRVSRSMCASLKHCISIFEGVFTAR